MLTPEMLNGLRHFFPANLLAAAATCTGVIGIIFPGTALAGAAEWERATKTGAEAFKENRYGEAERQFQSALHEAKKLGANDLRLATSLTNLGVLYNARGQFDKAEPLFEQAVTIKQKALGPFDIDVVDSAARLCQFYLKRKKCQKADALCQRIEQFGEMQIRSYKNASNAFAQLADFYSHHRELDKARTLLNETKQCTESKTNNQCLELAVLLDQVADAYVDRYGEKSHARKPDAEKLYKESLCLREHVLTGNHLALAQSYANLGKVYASEDRHAMAEPLLEKAYEVCKGTIGLPKPKTYEYLDAYAQTELGLGKGQTAERLYRQALESFQSAYGVNSSNVAEIDVALATVLEHQGQYQEAAKLVGSALKIKEKVYGPNHASLASVLDKYAYLLNKIDRQKEASRLQARANQIRG